MFEAVDFAGEGKPLMMTCRLFPEATRFGSSSIIGGAPRSLIFRLWRLLWCKRCAAPTFQLNP